MARGQNLCIFVGNLGADPEMRSTQNGLRICNIRVACTTGYINKNTGEDKTHTEWVRGVCFSQRAEFMERNLRKGDLVFLQGELRSRQWENSEGEKRYITEVLINDVQKLGGAAGEFAGETSPEKRRAAERGPKQEFIPGTAPPASPSPPPPQTGSFDDDIPF